MMLLRHNYPTKYIKDNNLSPHCIWTGVCHVLCHSYVQNQLQYLTSNVQGVIRNFRV